MNVFDGCLCPDCVTPERHGGVMVSYTTRTRYWTSYGTAVCEDGIERWFGVRNDGAAFVSTSKIEFDAHLSKDCSCSLHNRERDLCLVHSKFVTTEMKEVHFA